LSGVAVRGEGLSFHIEHFKKQQERPALPQAQLPAPLVQAQAQLRLLGLDQKVQIVHHAAHSAVVHADGYCAWPNYQDLCTHLGVTGDLTVFREVLARLTKSGQVKSHLSNDFLCGMLLNDMAIDRIEQDASRAPQGLPGPSIRFAAAQVNFGSRFLGESPKEYFTKGAGTTLLRSVEAILLLAGLGKHMPANSNGMDCLDIISMGMLVNLRVSGGRVIVSSRPLSKDASCGVVHVYQDIIVQ